MSGSNELELVRESVRRFAVHVVAPALTDLNHFPDRNLPARLTSGLADLGLFELESGRSLGVALEALSQIGAAPAAIVLANAYARRVVRAAKPALLEENGSGASLFAVQLYAEPGLVDAAPTLARRRDELVLDGTALLMVNAPIAGRLLLTAKDASSDGAHALCVVDVRAAGVAIGPPLLTLGLRGAPTADVTLSGVRIGAERLIATGPHAAALARATARRMFGPAAALVAGIVQSSLQTATAYAEERYQGGSSIIEHQEVRALLAQMLEAHAVCQATAEQLEAEDVPEHRALSLFIAAKERAAHATTDGVQLLGGNGYMEDYGQERCMRDAKQAQCLFGRTPYQRQELMAAFTGEVVR